jgi:hypothetical protein
LHGGVIGGIGQALVEALWRRAAGKRDYELPVRLDRVARRAVESLGCVIGQRLG